jgi:hypothetical protein
VGRTAVPEDRHPLRADGRDVGGIDGWCADRDFQSEKSKRAIERICQLRIAGSDGPSEVDGIGRVAGGLHER